MRTIAHLSDLHFGRVDRRVAAGLADHLAQLAPDLVAISGDLTQRARRWQFHQAREYLGQLPQPQLVVPGNHDVPLYNVLARFGDPLGNYRRYITRDLHPVFEDPELVVVGVDTTRSFTIKDGGIRPRDVARVASVLASDEASRVRIVVCHHPFDEPSGRIGRLTRPRPDAAAMSSLIGRGVDIFLTGHLHVSFSGHTATRYRTEGRAAIVVEAGTATSTRVRNEPNAFNLLRVDSHQVIVERLAWTDAAARFDVADTRTFQRSADGWV